MPILRREYSDSAPIKEHTSVGDFLDRYWLQKSAAAYLHQWQFPLSKTAVPKLCYRCDPPPCLDEDLLKHWLDICLGDNPLQYLFMGEASTSSKLHIDPGGLDLLIAPIIGEKQVTLVHRDDSELIMATVHDDDESDDDDAAATSPDGFDATHSSLTRETRLPPSRRARARARALGGVLRPPSNVTTSRFAASCAFALRARARTSSRASTSSRRAKPPRASTQRN